MSDTTIPARAGGAPQPSAQSGSVLEAYLRQAKNIDAELMACEIRLRAERKAGVLLRAMEKAKGILKRGQDLPQSCIGQTKCSSEV